MLCPHCLKGTLTTVAADEPWHDEHLQCNVCDSTYNDTIETRVKTLEAISKLPVSGYNHAGVHHFVFGPREKPFKTVCTYRKARVFAEGVALGRRL